MTSIFSHSKAHLTALTLSDLDRVGPNSHYTVELPKTESEIAHDLWMDKKIRTDEYRAVFNGEASLIEAKQQPDHFDATECHVQLNRTFQPIRCYVGLKRPWRLEARSPNGSSNPSSFMYFERQEDAAAFNETGLLQLRARLSGKDRCNHIDWPQFFDGREHTLVAGKDYTCNKHHILSRLWSASKRHGSFVEVSTANDRFVTFKAIGGAR